MEVMGMRNVVIWSVWILLTLATMLVICIELTLVLKFGNILPLSDPLLIFCMLVSFSVSVVMFRSVIFCNQIVLYTVEQRFPTFLCSRTLKNEN